MYPDMNSDEILNAQNEAELNDDNGDVDESDEFEPDEDEENDEPRLQEDEDEQNDVVDDE